MDSKRINLSRPIQSGSEYDFVQAALLTNWITSGGPNVDAFETELQNYFEQKVFVSALNSGTSAIHLALILLGVKSGDEVICQSMTFSASANPILYQNAIPVFVDSEEETWNICPDSLEIAIKDRLKKGKKPKAIIAVHLYGMPYKVDEIHDIADKYEIPIIEDSAAALGSKYKGKKCGSFGSFGVISFNGNKIITTSSGGVLTTNSLKLKDKAIFYATQSKDKAVHYQHSEIGYNYRMSNICAGIGLGQIKILANNIELRRNNHVFYREIFNGVKSVKLLDLENKDFCSNYWLSTILLDSYENRESLRKLFEDENIETRPLWKPMHLQPLFKNYPYYGNKVAEDLFKTGLCLPSGADLADEDKMRIKIVLESFFK